MFLRAGAVFAVLRAALGNPILRRVGLAYALFVAAEFGIWIALLVFAYDHGGAGAATLMVIVQLVPCIASGPFIGALADRQRPSRILRVGYGLQAVTMGTAAVAIGLGAPVYVVFLLAPLTSLSLTTTRSPQAALLPAIVRTPEELTAANVMTGWTDGAAALVGPALIGLLVASSGLGVAVAATGLMSLLALALVTGVAGPAAAVSAAEPAEEPSHGGRAGRRRVAPWTAELRRAVRSIRSGAGSNLGIAAHNPQIRVLLTLHTFYFVLVGALDLLCVILAVDYLHMGQGGAGYLNAALGAGALLAAFVTAFLVGRRHLARTLTAALAIAVAALALIGATHRVVPVLLLIGCVGLAGATFDTTGRTLLQRSVPSDAIAGSFSILESLMDVGLLVGAVLVRLGLSIGGLRAALLAPAIGACVLVVLLWRPLQRIDASATVPQVEIQLLRSIPIFAALPAPSLEGMAKELAPMEVAAGVVVIREGDVGDSYFAVADGRLTVSRGGRHLQTISRGEGFGEIALIRQVPRQATVTAETNSLLYSLRKELFVETVTGHATAASATHTVIDRHLGDDSPEPEHHDARDD